jgi:hypothetical protein
MPGFNVTDRLKSAWSLSGFVPEQMATRAQWLEIVLISFGAVGFAWWIRPLDPSLSMASFPWLWLAPVLVALRYGVLPGLLGCVALIGNEWLATRLGRAPLPFSAAPLFGGGLLVLLCGEFSDVWRDRNRRMEESYLYVSERLSRLTKRHLLLNLSHDRLEQEMLARPGSLRDALVRLRGLSMEKAQHSDHLPGAAGMLQLLSQYVNIESAELYSLKEQAGGYVLGPSAARLGEPVSLAPDDELLVMALETGNLAHVASKDISLKRHTSQLVVAPLIAGDSELVGVLAVTHMPFFSLNSENLQMMLVLLGYFADNQGSVRGVLEIQKRLPEMPVLFAQELLRMMRMHQKIGIVSHLVVMRFSGGRRQEIPAEFLRIKRGLDLYWQTYVQDTPVLVVLMPFASSSAKDGFLLRVEDWLRIRFQGDFVSLQVQLRVVDFDLQDPLNALSEAMNTP